ncbi:hypothetical protein [Kalamiella sp. sgz302252]|uniref:hypothetical protein n=1 Tax=Pantoea sp. sgz302252 TaxID=3341827 RepID=UPI0036D2768E
MKIKECDGELVDIYAIYFINCEVNFLGMPKNYGGLSAYSAREVTIVEPEIKGEYVFFKNVGHGIYHWALIKEDLLDGLLELDQTAYNRFLEILKAEGQIDPDFC